MTSVCYKVNAVGVCPEALSSEASPFINYHQGRDNKAEHFALFFFHYCPLEKLLAVC